MKKQRVSTYRALSVFLLINISSITKYEFTIVIASKNDRIGSTVLKKLGE